MERESTPLFAIVREASEAIGWTRQEIIDGIRGDDIEIATYEDAEEKAGEYIENSVWAFNAEFLIGYMPNGMTIEAIQAIQEKYEDANDSLKSLIGDDWEDFVESAIGCDGLGHFLSSYDGEAHEICNANYVVWRT